MLNVFPILFLALLAHAILRFVVGVIFVRFALQHIRHRESLTERFRFTLFPFPRILVIYTALVECVIGLMFIAGYYTQIAALLSMILCIKFIILHRKFKGVYIPQRLVYVLLFTASLSLFITGAGAFAFDLPI